VTAICHTAICYPTSGVGCYAPLSEIVYYGCRLFRVLHISTIMRIVVFYSRLCVQILFGTIFVWYWCFLWSPVMLLKFVRWVELSSWWGEAWCFSATFVGFTRSWLLFVTFAADCRQFVSFHIFTILRLISHWFGSLSLSSIMVLCYVSIICLPNDIDMVSRFMVSPVSVGDSVFVLFVFLSLNYGLNFHWLKTLNQWQWLLKLVLTLVEESCSYVLHTNFWIWCRLQWLLDHW